MTGKAPNMEKEQREEQLAQSLDTLELGSKESLDLLVDAIQHESWRIRKKAINALVTWPKPHQAVEKLITVAQEIKNPTSRNTALEALVRLQDSSVDYLCNEVANKNPARKLFIDTLGIIGEHRCADVVITAIADDDNNVQMAAAEALGKIGGPKAQKALESTLDKNNLLVTVAALDSLWKIGKRVNLSSLIPLLENRGTRRPAIHVLGLTADPKAIPLLSKALKDRIPGVRQAALEASVVLYSQLPEQSQKELKNHVLELTSEETHILVKHLDSQKAGVRRASATVLSWTKDKTVVEPLLRTALDEETGEHALEALSSMANTVIPEIGRLAQSFSGEQRLALYELLIRLPDVDSNFNLDTLIKAAINDLKSPEEEIASAALRVLGNFGDEHCLEPIFSLLGDKSTDSFTRHDAAQAIGLLGERFPQAVIQCLTSPKRNLLESNHLRAIITRMKNVELFPLLRSLLESQVASDRREAVRCLSSFPHVSEAEELTIEALSDESELVRAAAASAMSNFDSSQNPNALLEALHDNDPEVRSRAAGAIGDRQWVETTQPLHDLILSEKEPLVIVSALEALGKMGDIQDERLLQISLNHQNTEVIKAGLSLIKAETSTLKNMVIDKLSHENWDVRLQAVRACKHFFHHGDTIKKALEKFLLSETDPLVKKVANEILTTSEGKAE